MRRKAVVLIFLSFIFYWGAAQENKLYFDNYTLQNGLTDNYINCILQDRDGWIWLGAGMGAVRFDGIRFKKYPVYINDSISKNNVSVRNFYEAKNGVLYACVEELGLFKYSRDLDIFDRVKFNNKEILHDVSVKEIVEDKDKNFWAATKRGIVKIDFQREKLTSFLHDRNNENSLAGNYVRALAFDSDSNIWVGSKAGLQKFNPSTGVFTNYLTIEPALGDEILDILVESEQRIWVGTSSNGVFIINPIKNEVERFVLKRSNERSEKINSIFKDRDEQIWLGTRDGLYLYNERDDLLSVFNHNLLEERSLVHNSVMDVAQDEKGDIWVGTRGGLSHMVREKQAFDCYKAMPDNNRYLNNSEVYCIWSRNSELWVGTENGGVNILNRKTGEFRYLTESNNGVSNNCIKAIHPMDDENILIGTFSGGLNVHNINTGNTTVFKRNEQNPHSISDNLIWDITTDDYGNIWIGTGSGLDKYNPEDNTFEHYPHFDDMVNGITWIVVDEDNDLWLGSEVIRIFRPGVGIINSFDEKGRELYIDIRGNNWVMTSTRGIVLYDKYKGALKSYGEDMGLACNLTNCMLEDDMSRLWVSTANGLSCFKPETESFQNYFAIDGLQGNQFYYGAAAKTENGELVFGGKNGFNIFNQSALLENNYSPSVYITDLKIFNKSVEIGDDKHDILKSSILETELIEVPYHLNVLTFDFVALNYVNSTQNLYRYKLDGFDNEWTDAAETRNATYTNLDPGEYVFRVIGSNNRGYWNETGDKLKIVVLPPFYRESWFLVLILTLSMVLIFLLFIVFFRRWEMKKAYEFEKRENERKHELDMFKLQFFTNISHEIKTPLTLIISPLERIHNYEMTKSEIREALKMVHKNARHLMTLVTQLLDYRKIEEGKLYVDYKRGDVVQFCRDTFFSFESLMKESGLSYHFKSIQEEFVTSFDPDKLKKILDNLISNAIRYNKPGGDVSFYFSLVIDDNIDEGSDNEFVKIVVKDTGQGIPKEQQNRIFRRFYTGKNNKSTSTGIGLAFTRELIDLLGGRITLQSEEDEGATFTIMLPLVENESKENVLVKSNDDENQIENEENDIDVQNDEMSNKKIILIVEDNYDIRKFIKSHFIKSYQVYEAENGQQGFEIAVDTVPDIIISDIMMPIVDGIELCERIKNDERTSHIPLIHLTVLSSKDRVMESLAKGADDYITKPFDIAILQTKVDNLLSMRDSLREKYSKELVLKPSSIKITSPDEKFLQKAMQIVEDNIDDTELDIEKFVSFMGMSRMQLYRKMSALTKMTVKEFINDIRLKRAHQLLSENSLNVSEAAYSVGFSDVSYFGKCFKKKFGISAGKVVKK
ncbi:MAG: response regulator [Prolixibacteraceae bacterium]|jgi:signal transduction histidine kinase/ligand-binding sensor domain-containing protein/DNA-binding response OmpR family regulator|nr:response regulator [Prolixibacteraceae bacterium]